MLFSLQVGYKCLSPAERDRARLISRPRTGSLLIVSSSEVRAATLAVASYYQDANFNPGRFINWEALQVQCIGQLLVPTAQTWTWPLGAVCVVGYLNGSCANYHYDSDGAIAGFILSIRQLVEFNKHSDRTFWSGPSGDRCCNSGSFSCLRAS